MYLTRDYEIQFQISWTRLIKAVIWLYTIQNIHSYLENAP